MVKELKRFKANVAYNVCRAKSKIAAKSYHVFAKACNDADIRNAWTDKVVNGLVGMYENATKGQLKALYEISRLTD